MTIEQNVWGATPEGEAIIIYTLKNALGSEVQLTNIGAAIGDRNHATVLHSCKTISNLMDTEKVFRQQVEQIEKILLS